MKKICPICKGEYLGGEVFCAVDAARLITASQVTNEPVDADDRLIGTTLDRYKVIRRIGEGGMGLVYEGFHLAIEKRVAIKVLRDDFSSRSEVVERFRQEAKSASRIGHKNIVDISDFGSTPSGQSYFVMEFLDGEDLADSLAHNGTLSVERILHINLQCAKALAAAHKKGIVHRDMKPENVFLAKREDDPDFVKIVDFGIAKMSDVETSGAPGRKLTKTGMIFGTPEYMSPEQAAGKGLDHRVDIYAMGVIMYELVTGRVPFVGDTFMGVLTQHVFETAPPLLEINPHAKVSAELEDIIFRCLSKDPDDRYPNMEELAEALADAQLGRVREPTQLGYRDPSTPRKKGPDRSFSRSPTLSTEDGLPLPKKRAYGLWAAGLVVMLLGAGVTYWLSSRTDPSAGQTPDLIADGDAPPDMADPPNGTHETADPNDPNDPDSPTGDGQSGVETDEPTTTPQPTLVALTIETAGGSAVIRIEGQEDPACATTPCLLQVTPGQSLTILARRGRFRGSLSLTPTATATIAIPLRARRPHGMSMRAMDAQMGVGVNSSGDLKMVDFFE